MLNLDDYRTTGLVLSKEERLFGVVEYAVFQGNEDYLRCVDDWTKARELLVEAHFDLVMVDESAVVNETFENFCSFIRRVANENTVCAFFVRSATPDLHQMKKVLGDVLTFVEMNQGKRAFIDALMALKDRAVEARQSENVKKQTASLDESMGRVDIDLPAVGVGSMRIKGISLARLLYAIRFRRLFGVLTLTPHRSADGETVAPFSFKLQQGRIVDCSKENLQKLFQLFASPNADFAFTEEEQSSQPQVPSDAIEPIDLIWEGVSKYAHESELHRSLSPLFHYKVIPTNLYRERCIRYSGIGVLGRLVEAVQKCATLEEAIYSIDYPTRDAYAAALFALRTDMLVVQQSPLHRFAQVVYPRDVRQQRQKVTDRAKRNTKAYRITSSDLQRVQIEDELRVRVEQFEKMTPYEVLGVWEGCGKKVVNDVFYKMVREHHPDTYGGNVSGDTKRYADRVFVLIQKARSDLLKREREQKCPDPNATRPPMTTPTSADGVKSPRLGMSSQFDSLAGFREGFDSSEISVGEFGLAGEVSDPEVRKQRIRNLHDKRRRLSSVSTPLHTPPNSSSRQRNQHSSLELPSLAGLTGPSVVRTSRPTTPVSQGEQKNETSRSDRLERLSRFSTQPSVASMGTSNSRDHGGGRQDPSSGSAGGMKTSYEVMKETLVEGMAEFERGNWGEAIRLLLLAQHYVDDKKIDVFLAYARYMQDSSYRSDALAELELGTTDRETAFEAHRFMGKIYADSEGWELAKACFKSALGVRNDASVRQELETIENKIKETQPSGSLFGRFFQKKK